MKGTRGNEQDVIGLDHAVLGVHGAAFNQRQQVALYAFAGYIATAMGFATATHLVDFIEKHNAVLLDRFQCGLLLSSSSLSNLAASSS
jgi:hypothetical protein